MRVSAKTKLFEAEQPVCVRHSLTPSLDRVLPGDPHDGLHDIRCGIVRVLADR